MRLWSFLNALSLFISCFASGSVATTLYISWDLRRSALRQVFFYFFFYCWLWSLFHGSFYVALIGMDESTYKQQFTELSDDQYDALGLRGVAKITELTRPWLSFVLVMGDTFLFANSLCLFPITAELYRLARKSKCRSMWRELQISRRYFILMHTAISIFFLVNAGFTIANRGYNKGSTRLMLSGSMLQVVGLVYVSLVMIRLKCMGRNYETINGCFVVSPLYRRIKSLLIVYGVFSLQYQVISFWLLCSHFDDDVPPMVVGLSTVLFNNSGTALSFVMGCSQERVLQAMAHWFPEEFTQHLSLNARTMEVDGANEDVRSAAAIRMSSPSRLFCFSRSSSGSSVEDTDATAMASWWLPRDYPVFVYTDVESSSALWAIGNGKMMHLANDMCEDLIRIMVYKHRGYEITTCGDAFHLAFHTIRHAIEFCIEVQCRLLHTDWPIELHDALEATRQIRSVANGKLIFNGLRLRMGVHDAQPSDGVLLKLPHVVTRKVMFTGISEIIVSELSDIGNGGQILVSWRVAKWLQDNRDRLHYDFDVEFVSRHEVSNMNLMVDVFQVVICGLQDRKCFFKPLRSANTLSPPSIKQDQEGPSYERNREDCKSSMTICTA